jgi:hypothetical protein
MCLGIVIRQAWLIYTPKLFIIPLSLQERPTCISRKERKSQCFLHFWT